MRIAKFVIAVMLVLPSFSFAAIVDVAVGPGFSFAPNPVTVAPGDTVRWTFLALHTSTSDLQSGPEFWDSGLMGSGTFLHTFNTPGNYPYYCSLHSSPAPGGTFMNAVVQVVAAPPPTLTSINPTSGSSAGGTSVTLTGTNFVGNCTVDFSGAAGTISTTTATTMFATTPAHAAGPVTVTASCAGGSATLVNSFTFNSAPGITSFTPASGLPGQIVTINGTSFVSGATVTFGGVASPTVNFVSATSLTAVVPNMPAGPVSITVTNPDTTNVTAPGFTVLSSIAVPLMSREMLILLAIVIGITAAMILSTRS